MESLVKNSNSSAVGKAMRLIPTPTNVKNQLAFTKSSFSMPNSFTNLSGLNGYSVPRSKVKTFLTVLRNRRLACRDLERDIAHSTVDLRYSTFSTPEGSDDDMYEDLDAWDLRVQLGTKRMSVADLDTKRGVFFPVRKLQSAAGTIASILPSKNMGDSMTLMEREICSGHVVVYS
jgi:hypothetical protein